MCQNKGLRLNRILTDLTAAEAAIALRDGSLSVEAYARACLDRIEAQDRTLQAWAFVDRDQAIASARALDGRATRGPLHGVPIGVKDVILTEDMPTQYNSERYSGAFPRMDAACVALLRSAGALILGKTHTVEFAATGRPAPTRNPHDHERTPGGSSSGSAAAVADFHVPIALGTQTGGSMIRPASFCGVYAIKPTWGLVSREGAKMFAPSLDTIGWFTRTAGDLALIYDVLDPEPCALPDVTLAGARIGLCRSPAWEQASPATRQALADGAIALQSAGAEIVELELPPTFATGGVVHSLIMNAEGRASFLPEYRSDADAMHPNLRAIAENASGATRDDLRNAYDQAAVLRLEFDSIAAEFDAILTPSVVGEAPLGLSATGAMTFNALWTLLHVPCVNVPGLKGPSGLPVGLTITGQRYSDRRLLSLASQIGARFVDAG